MGNPDELDKRLLNLIQEDFPVVGRPYEALGQMLGTTGAEIIDRISRLRQQRIIRQISAIFDTRSLGYQSSLVAMRVDPARVDEAAEVVNSHPGVSHNYKRNHTFNLWFTVGVPATSSLHGTIDRLHELARAESTRLLPTLKLFKIGVQLDMEGKNDAAAKAEPTWSEARRGKPSEITPFDIRVIREFQVDLPLLDEPFTPMADRLGVGLDELLTHAEGMKDRGYMRRFAAVLHHREAGFKANAMGVWKVPKEREMEVGPVMGSFRAVSHCYLRPTYPDWPYNIFTMVHGRSPSDCDKVIDAIAAETGINEHAMLYSTKQYKKVRLKYFTEELERWEEEHLVRVQ